MKGALMKVFKNDDFLNMLKNPDYDFIIKTFNYINKKRGIEASFKAVYCCHKDTAYLKYVLLPKNTKIYKELSVYSETGRPWPHIKSNRDAAIRAGFLKDYDDQYYITTVDICFSTPSEAVSFLIGYPVNGYDALNDFKNSGFYNQYEIQFKPNIYYGRRLY